MEIIASLALVGASFGVVAAAGLLYWGWLKFSLLLQKHYW